MLEIDAYLENDYNSLYPVIRLDFINKIATIDTGEKHIDYNFDDVCFIYHFEEE